LVLVAIGLLFLFYIVWRITRWDNGNNARCICSYNFRNNIFC
jgi:hypothetical protein